MTITKKEIATVRMALSDAIRDREEFLNCYKNRYSPGFMKGSVKIVRSTISILKKYEALDQKIRSCNKSKSAGPFSDEEPFDRDEE